MNFGSEFEAPKNPHRDGKLWTPAQTLVMHAACRKDPNMQAMVLLAINAGFGPTDCATLKLEDLDLEAGVYDSRRHKTAVPRRAVLWPSTLDAIQQCAGTRCTGLVFLTPQGRPYYRVVRNESRIYKHNLASRKFMDIRDASSLKGTGLTFYGLRHTFNTIADMSGDTNAVRYIMGHKLQGMQGVYNHMKAQAVLGLTDVRLRKVADGVHRWLYGVGMDETTPPVWTVDASRAVISSALVSV